MMEFEMIFDVLVCVLLLALAWRTLTAPRLYQAAILFVAFGLVMALTWTRLAAPDVALAEAAIGAGLLGVLLIDSLRVFGRRPPEGSTGSSPSPRRVRWKRWATAAPVAAACALLAWLLVGAVLELPDEGGLTAEAAARIPESGVEHPVTAVLLNFRGYDTWLEIGVLWLAMLGIFCAGGRTGFLKTPARVPAPDPLVDWLARVLVPLVVLTAGYLLWLGKFAPGGAFQSGVVLGAGAIFLHLAGWRVIDGLRASVWKAALALGFGFFLLVGIMALLSGRAFLEYPPGRAGELILLVEATAAFSIGFTLAAFFVFLASSGQEDGEEKGGRG